MSDQWSADWFVGTSSTFARPAHAPADIGGDVDPGFGGGSSRRTRKANKGRGSAIRRADVESEVRSQETRRVTWLWYRREEDSGGRSRGPSELPSNNLGLKKLEWWDLVVLTARPADDESGKTNDARRARTGQDRTRPSDGDKMGWCLLSRGRWPGGGERRPDASVTLQPVNGLAVWTTEQPTSQPWETQQNNNTPWGRMLDKAYPDDM